MLLVDSFKTALLGIEEVAMALFCRIFKWTFEVLLLLLLLSLMSGAFPRLLPLPLLVLLLLLLLLLLFGSGGRNDIVLLFMIWLSSLVLTILSLAELKWVVNNILCCCCCCCCCCTTPVSRIKNTNVVLLYDAMIQARSHDLRTRGGGGGGRRYYEYE